MKSMLTIVSFLFLSSAYADGPCVDLAKFVGTYKQISKSCDHDWFGPELTVVPFDENNSWPDLVGKGYWITSASAGFGPTTKSNGMDKCTLTDGGLSIEISGNDKFGSTLPQKGRVGYFFSGTQVKFRADQCTAVYSK
ncbi:MAG: hypothetical protein ACXVCP_07565 [Bdellovibrio sp.]